MDDFLITLDDIAAMHKCDAKHARDIIVRCRQAAPGNGFG